MVTALDKNWHPECFCCVKCSRAFGEEGKSQHTSCLGHSNTHKSEQVSAEGSLFRILLESTPAVNILLEHVRLGIIIIIILAIVNYLVNRKGPKLY